MKGAEAIIECLKKEGVEKIFGYPGGAVINIYDALYSEEDIDHILSRHEQGAVHAADGYARVTGKTGVCIATSGPGATNLVTGMANAHMDSVPILAITGQVSTPMIGNDAFQEADITGITLPITKHNKLLRSASELPQSFKEGFHIANTGRPGPVLLDIPKDVQNEVADFEYPEKIDMKGYNPTYSGHPLQIKKACKAILEAERPIICAGGGVISSNASEELRELSELSMAPVTTTLMGKGAFDERHPLSLGMLGMHGRESANYALTESDLLIGVGIRFDDRVTGRLEGFAPDAKVIHIDIDPAEISKNVDVHIPIVGDAKKCLQKLNQKLSKAKLKKDDTNWHKKIKKWKKESKLDYNKEGEKIKPQLVVEKINDLSPDDTIISTEVGQCQMWAAQFFEFKKPRTLITSGGLGTMGYGLPAAIGAQVGKPNKKVWNIAGDGSIQMTIQEIGTAAKYNLPINVAILNNNYLGMVRQWQELFFDERYSETSLKDNPDFEKIAEGFGAKGMVIEDKGNVEEAIKIANSSDKPYVIDFRVDNKENVYPMVPAGGSLTEIISRRDAEGV